VKIGPLTEALRYLNSVHDKKDTDNNGQQSGRQHQQNPEKREENPEVFEVSDQKVGAAIDAFQHDSQAVANGLNAEIAGKGPGLRVILKDGSGAVVRQFTGEEFLKLREATLGQFRGKILDQKA
jgi:uncharacterized FlaG/YvyC family protein